ARAGSGGRIRVYSQRDRARLKLLLRGKRLGLSLQEVKGLLDMYETPADSMSQLTRFLEVLDARRQSLRQQLADLNQLLADMDRHHAEAERTLRALQDGLEHRLVSVARSGQPVDVALPPSLMPAPEAAAMQNAVS